MSTILGRACVTRAFLFFFFIPVLCAAMHIYTKTLANSGYLSQAKIPRSAARQTVSIKTNLIASCHTHTMEGVVDWHRGLPFFLDFFFFFLSQIARESGSWSWSWRWSRGQTSGPDKWCKLWIRQVAMLTLTHWWKLNADQRAKSQEPWGERSQVSQHLIFAVHLADIRNWTGS